MQLYLFKRELFSEVKMDPKYNPCSSLECKHFHSKSCFLKGQYRHDRSRLSTGHGISVLA